MSRGRGASSVEVTTGGPVARLRLSRPDEGNAIDLELAAGLRNAIDRICDAGAVVAVLEAQGPLFCGGGDIAAMAGAADRSAYTRELADTLHDALLAMADSPVITIAAVHGAVAGAGLGLVLNADLVVAASGAKFMAAYGSLGVTPDGGASYLLPRIAGVLRASEILIGGVSLDAATAHSWGLVNRVVGLDELPAAVEALAASVASTPAAVLAKTKRLISAGLRTDYADPLRAESESISSFIASEESIRRQSAFLVRAGRRVPSSP